jgi:hypothetical protein
MRARCAPARSTPWTSAAWCSSKAPRKARTDISSSCAKVHERGATPELRSRRWTSSFSFRPGMRTTPTRCRPDRPSCRPPRSTTARNGTRTAPPSATGPSTTGPRTAPTRFARLRKGSSSRRWCGRGGGIEADTAEADRGNRCEGGRAIVYDEDAWPVASAKLNGVRACSMSAMPR